MNQSQCPRGRRDVTTASGDVTKKMAGSVGVMVTEEHQRQIALLIQELDEARAQNSMVTKSQLLTCPW